MPRSHDDDVKERDRAGQRRKTDETRIDAESVTLPPPSLSFPEEALYGVLGDFTRAMRPYVEADDANVFLTTLAMAGTYLGRRPVVNVGNVTNHLNEFVNLVGASSTGRKGTGGTVARRLFARVDPGWEATNIVTGLSSGEGAIALVRDATTNRKGDTTDEGVIDKRVLCFETELARTIIVQGRESSTLTYVLLQLWDGAGVVRSIVRNSPLVATRPHVSIVGHGVPGEMAKLIGDNLKSNGWVNRALWAFTDSARDLPNPPLLTDATLDTFAKTIEAASEWAEHDNEGASLALVLSPTAQRWWVEHVYGVLKRPQVPAYLHAMLARGHPHVMRVAAILAALDRSALVRTHHLAAALWVWDYNARTISWLFGGGQSDTHRRIVALAKAHDGKVSLTDLHYGLTHRQRDESPTALEQLVESGVLDMYRLTTGGRPSFEYRLNGQHITTPIADEGLRRLLTEIPPEPVNPRRRRGSSGERVR